MNSVRSKTYRLIDQLSDDELVMVWGVLEPLHYDLYLLKAIQDAKKSLSPGDSLTREEALRFLAAH